MTALTYAQPLEMRCGIADDYEVCLDMWHYNTKLKIASKDCSKIFKRAVQSVGRETLEDCNIEDLAKLREITKHSKTKNHHSKLGFWILRKLNYEIIQ